MDRILRSGGQPFVIYRGEERVGEATGLKDAKQRKIIFPPDVEILVGDWLEDQKAQTRLFVTDVDHPGLSRSGRRSRLSHIRVLYETGIEYERQESTAQVVAMLDDIADAIWTLSDEKMPPEEKKRARAAVRELQRIVMSLPSGAAGGLTEAIASRLLDRGG